MGWLTCAHQSQVVVHQSVARISCFPSMEARRKGPRAQAQELLKQLEQALAQANSSRAQLLAVSGAVRRHMHALWSPTAIETEFTAIKFNMKRPLMPPRACLACNVAMQHAGACPHFEAGPRIAAFLRCLDQVGARHMRGKHTAVVLWCTCLSTQ
jgi:hypothetical protein